MAQIDSVSPTKNPGQLLFTRKQLAAMFGNVSIFTIIRMEKAGDLRPIKLGRSATAQTFYAYDDVMALVAAKRAEPSKS